MAIQIKDPGVLAKKWSTRAQAAAPDFVAGADSPKVSPTGAAAAAGPTWQAAVQSPDALKRFQSHLAKAGDAAWAAGIKGKGAARYGQGVAAAMNKWQANTTPYLQVLASLTLPARGLRRSAQNIARVQAVDAALAAAKQSASG